MSGKRLKRKKLHSKLFTKNRLVILNEDSFEEIFSLKLNLMNVFVVATIGAIFLISVTTFIIAFTPLREFIPGYSSSKLKRDATELALKSDSLTIALKKNEAYIQSIQKVLNGELEYAKFNKDSILATSEEVVPQVKLSASEEELELREQVAKEEKNSQQTATKGKITNSKK
ncbi:peptidase [Flavobacterium sp. XN-5]|uniref:peptidase n=1 Tax=Flavobacterium sp. XN-5 TaxID=2599390 RepID=UPI0011CB5422|nr:peptidase [Flavobacterium sp. XN-5]NGY36689.1 peptidase [Flavobacterium sp. XN-5]